jgi:hypothetical protein
MKLLLLPNPTKNERNKFLKEIASRSNVTWDLAFDEEDTKASAFPDSMSHVSILITS